MESLLHETDQSGYNMLHHAAPGGHADVVRLAVEEYNLDFTARDVVSVYPQCVSCKVHCLSIVLDFSLNYSSHVSADDLW